MKYILKLTRLLTHVMYKSITIVGKFNGAKKSASNYAQIGELSNFVCF